MKIGLAITRHLIVPFVASYSSLVTRYIRRVETAPCVVNQGAMHWEVKKVVVRHGLNGEIDYVSNKGVHHYAPQAARG